MNKLGQDKNEYELTVIKTGQYLSQERNNSESKSLEQFTNQETETETEWFYIKKIKKINYKNIILKIISFGCLNYLINEKNANEIKPWVEKLIILQEKNKVETLRYNQSIIDAEKFIENFEKSHTNNIVIKQQINADELFYDALDNQSWLDIKQVSSHHSMGAYRCCL